ncbi:hypothetical protein AKO1_005394 [Acrasis kona]|uniref:DOP1-like C-terminal domain-containing protein n=1 Tax=Acrasis kona TaxID=1008807 RepID=A0AAW2YKA6_9EUKA
MCHLQESNDSLKHVHALHKSIQGLLDDLLVKHPVWFMCSLVIAWCHFHPESTHSIQITPHHQDQSLFNMIDSLEGALPDMIVSHLVHVMLNIKKTNHQVEIIKESVAVSLLNGYLTHTIMNPDQPTSSKMLAGILQMVHELGTNPPSSQIDPMLISHMIQTLIIFIHKFPNAQDHVKKIKSNVKDQTARLIDAACLCCVREMNSKRSQLTKSLQSDRHVDHEQILHDLIHDPYDSSLQILLSMTLNDGLVDLLQCVYKYGIDPADKDRIQYVTSGVVSTLCNILKNHGLDNALRITKTTKLIKTLRRLPNHALKNAKKDIWDVFNEPAFFRTQAEGLRDWRVLMVMASGAIVTLPNALNQSSTSSAVTLSSTVVEKTVTDRVQDMLPGRIADKLTNNMLTNAISTTGTILSDTLAPQDNPLKSATLLFDLLQRFGTSQSIFSSRDTESVTRAKLMKRVAFLVLTGNVDDYHAHYPSILEKMVDSLKTSSNSAPVVCSFLLLMRVIVCRSSAVHLNLFWPTMVTELIRILGDDDAQENHGHREVSVLVEAIKFLDYVICVLPDAFQIYKWIFVGEELSDQPCFFVPFLNKNLTGGDVDDDIVNTDKRRPLLIQPSFYYYAHNQENVIMEWSRRLAKRAQLMDSDPGSFGSDWDKAFVDRLLENDFVEYKVEELILLQPELQPTKRENEHDFVVIDKVVV